MSKIQKVLLYPCAGSSVNLKNHIYAVDEVIDGQQIFAVDFMTIEQAKEHYKGIEVVVTDSHGMCPDCACSWHPQTTRDEVIKKFYPNYRGKF